MIKLLINGLKWCLASICIYTILLHAALEHLQEMKADFFWSLPR